MTMTAPIPAAVGAPSQIAAATQQHREGPTIDPGAVLRRLAVGSQHAGLVVGNTPDGRPQVSIDSALLTLDGVASLPAGTRVAIKITATAPSLAIELTVRNDGGVRALVTAADAAGAVVATATAATGANARPAPAATAATTTTTTATAGSSRNSSAPVALDKPALAATPAHAPAGAPMPAPTVTLLTPMTWRSDSSGDDPVAAAVRAKTLPAGTQLPVRVSLVPEGMAATAPATQSPAPALPALVPGRPLQAVVSTVLADGRAIVSLADGGAFVLSKTADLMPAIRVTLVLGEVPVPAWPPAAATGAAPLEAPWTALQTLAAGLEGESQAHALALLNASLPRPDAQLGARIHALLAAARGADPRELLGDDAVRHLARRRPELLAGIVRDLERTAAADSATERQAGCAWTAIDLPLLVGTAIEPLRLLLRHRPPRRQGSDGDSGDGHFVVEVTLRQLGRIQLDTMVRQGTPGMTGGAGVATRLDMMVRSERPLDATARQDIRELACAAGEWTGVRVGVGFQAGPPGFVDVPSQRAAGVTGDLIV